jgi:hypothetical protein
VLCDSAKKLTCKPRLARNLSSVYCIIQQKKILLKSLQFWLAHARKVLEKRSDA